MSSGSKIYKELSQCHQKIQSLEEGLKKQTEQVKHVFL